MRVSADLWRVQPKVKVGTRTDLQVGTSIFCWLPNILRGRQKEDWRKCGASHKEMGNLVAWDMEKAELLKDFFCLGLHREELQPHHPRRRRQRQGLGEWRTTHCGRSGVRLSKEPEAAQVVEHEEAHLCVS